MRNFININAITLVVATLQGCDQNLVQPAEPSAELADGPRDGAQAAHPKLPHSRGASANHPRRNQYANRQSYQQFDLNHWFFYSPRYLDILESEARAALEKAQGEREEAEARARLLDEQRQVLEQARADLAREMQRLNSARVDAYYQARALQLIQSNINLVKDKGITKPTQIAALRDFLRMSMVDPATLANMEAGPFSEDQFKLWTSRGIHKIKPFGQSEFENNMQAYLLFLEANYQNVRIGSNAHKALLSLLKDADQIFSKWFIAQMENDKANELPVKEKFERLRALTDSINSNENSDSAD